MKKRKAILLLVVLLTSSLAMNLGCSKGDLTDYGDRLVIAKLPYIISPTNTTYTDGPITLAVNFSAPVFSNIIYSMNYSLDGSKNATVPLATHYFGFELLNESYLDGNVALPQLYAGSHHITVYLEYYTYANNSVSPTGPFEIDSRRAYDSQTVYFDLAGPSTQSPTIPEFPLVLFLVIILSASIVLSTTVAVREQRRVRFIHS